MYVCIYICIYLYVYVCVYVCIYICVYIYVCICMCVYIYTYIFINPRDPLHILVPGKRLVFFVFVFFDGVMYTYSYKKKNCHCGYD